MNYLSVEVCKLFGVWIIVKFNKFPFALVTSFVIFYSIWSHGGMSSIFL